MKGVAVVGLVLLLAAVACSEQVPAPVTPTPSPRPGYPPAPISELPEGVLLVQRPSTSLPPLFAIDKQGEPHRYEWDFVLSVSPEQSRAIVVRSDRMGGFEEIALLDGVVETAIAPEDWGFKAGDPWPNLLWSPDGARLAFTLPDDAAPDRLHVWTVNLSRESADRMTEDSDYYTPIAWTGPEDLLVQAPHRVLVLGAKRREFPLPEQNQILDLRASPDGSLLAAMLGYFEQREPFGVTRATGLWLLDMRSAKWTRLVDLGGAEWAAYFGATTSWSPDGNRLAYYESYTSDDGIIHSGLAVIDARTGAKARLHDQGGWPHAWSPDGKYLAYTYETLLRPDTLQVLGVLGPDGKAQETRLLVRGMGWSRDGRLLVKRANGLSVIDPETLSEIEVLTDAGDPVYALLGFEQWLWSPSGRYIAAATPGDQYVASSLYIIDTQEGVARLFYDRAGFYPLAWLKE